MRLPFHFHSCSKIADPLSWTYVQLAALRRTAYREGWLKTQALRVPVISVGGLEMGGVGKTPIVRWIAEQFLAQGVKVGIVCRSYGGTCHGPEPVPLVKCKAASQVRFFGDEAVLLKKWLPNSILVCGRNKHASARMAKAMGAQVIVVDDGFQHFKLHRTLDILVHRGSWPAPLPWGRGREGIQAIQYADIIWCHHRGGQVDLDASSSRPLISKSLKNPKSQLRIMSYFAPSSLVGWDGTVLGSAKMLAGKKIHLLAGIANPYDFIKLITSLGGDIQGTTLIRDHRLFTERHLLRAARSQPDLLLCTEKDLVRMEGLPWAKDLVALTCNVVVDGGST